MRDHTVAAGPANVYCHIWDNPDETLHLLKTLIRAAQAARRYSCDGGQARTDWPLTQD
ncbi:MAG: hypothetical protein JWN52_2339 [Actinomycetia bacterium]|nr:hypothetical protein [Actinomycetes bacterium]